MEEPMPTHFSLQKQEHLLDFLILVLVVTMVVIIQASLPSFWHMVVVTTIMWSACVRTASNTKTYWQQSILGFLLLPVWCWAWVKSSSPTVYLLSLTTSDYWGELVKIQPVKRQPTVKAWKFKVVCLLLGKDMLKRFRDIFLIGSYW